MTATKYLDRQRCEAAGLEYDYRAIEQTLWSLQTISDAKLIHLLDKLSAQLNLQCAAYVESVYERAGVITGGGES